MTTNLSWIPFRSTGNSTEEERSEIEEQHGHSEIESRPVPNPEWLRYLREAQERESEEKRKQQDDIRREYEKVHWFNLLGSFWFKLCSFLDKNFYPNELNVNFPHNPQIKMKNRNALQAKRIAQERQREGIHRQQEEVYLLMIGEFLRKIVIFCRHKILF